MARRETSDGFVQRIKIMRFGLVISALLLAVSACNTVDGMGKDIQKGGQAIENAAQ